jgi:3-hydroxyisobutyrate dehydrogenase-like beta-hydroxyacid dehydrogenase/uncharacterized protein YoxC
MIFKRILGLLMIVVGLFGLVVCIAGIIYAPQVINRVGTALNDSMAVVSQTLDTAEDSLLLAQTTLEQVDAGLETVASAVGGVSGALRETTPMLGEVGKIVSEDIPDSLDALQSVVPEVARAAGVVEDALIALSEFRLEQSILGINLGFDLGFEYDPELSMAESIDGLGTSLDSMSPRLRALQTFMDNASGDLESMGQDIDQVVDTLDTLTGQLESAAGLLDSFLATVNDLQRTMEQAGEGLPQQLELAKIAAIVFLVWIGLAQLAPLYLGWELRRSQETHDRAAHVGLLDVGTVANLCETCSVILCVCPPYGAGAVANQVADCGFAGLYLDGNAISPERVRRIGERLAATGIGFVDGGIIGGPAWEPGRTCLYLSGDEAAAMAALFAAGPLEVEVIGTEIGRASALKMCYAANTKGTTALLCAILATAGRLGVYDELLAQWSREGSGLDESAPLRATRVTAKAWRFEGEMREISATFQQAGLPGGFHAAAAELYGRLAHLKDEPIPRPLEEVLAALATDEGARENTPIE